MQNIAFFYFSSNGEIKTNCIQNIHRKSSSDKNRNANFCKKLFICMYCKIGFTSVRFLDLPQKFSILHHIFYLIIVLCIHASSFVWNKNMNGIFLFVACVSIWNTLEAKKWRHMPETTQPVVHKISMWW